MLVLARWSWLTRKALQLPLPSNGLALHSMNETTDASANSPLDVCGQLATAIDGRPGARDTVALLPRANAYYQSASMTATGASRGRLPWPGMTARLAPWR
jgi:hypothetical protein